MSWIAGTIEDVKEIDNWFVMDIGFSSDQKSCGVVKVENNTIVKTKDDKDGIELDYSAMIEQFIDFTKGKTKIGLIIEAPLSIAFSKGKSNSDGNPAGRGGIEIEKNKEEATKTRYWYVGAGAAVTLSALHFLHQTKDNKQKDCDVHIYEGLLSFKNLGKQSHCYDAKDLYTAIINLAEQQPTEKSILGENQTPINTNMKFIGDYLGINLENGGIPAVIKVAKVEEKTSCSLHVYPHPIEK